MAKHPSPIDLNPAHAPAVLSLAERLGDLTLEALAGAYACLFGAKPEKGPKAVLLAQLAHRLVVETESGVEAFLSRLPPHLREAIRRGAFHRYVETAPLEKLYGRPIVGKRREYGYHEILFLEPEARLGIFGLIDAQHLRMSDRLREFFAERLPKPEGWTPRGLSGPGSLRYDASETIADSLLLALRFFAGRDRFEMARKGFTKREALAFETGCGLASFPVAGGLGLNAGELVARFLAVFASLKTEKPFDPHDRLRQAVVAFFQADMPVSFAYEDRGRLFEYRGLLDHLGKKPGGAANHLQGYPPSRDSFRACLGLAASGEWFAAEDLFAAAELRDLPTSIVSDLSREGLLKLLGERIELGEYIYSAREWSASFEPFGRLHRDLVSLPLFRAYSYLFAALGLLEIAEEQPPERLTRTGKKRPISPYDGLYAFRVTPLGAWILGHRPGKPAREERRGLILVDPDLLLLTMKGDSLERRVFLESIGSRLGTDRYKVTEASFIAGCESPGKIEERISRFHELVSGEPPALWKNFFELLRAKSRIFLEPEAALLFGLPADERIRRLFSSDPELRALARRVEGGFIAVRQADFPRLAKALSARGFHCPEPRRK